MHDRVWDFGIVSQDAGAFAAFLPFHGRGAGRGCWPGHAPKRCASEPLKVWAFPQLLWACGAWWALVFGYVTSRGFETVEHGPWASFE